MRVLLALLPLLGSTGFYNYHGMFSEGMEKGLLYFFILVAAIYAWLNPRKDVKPVHFPRIAWIALIALMVISTFMAILIHEQPIVTSFISSLQYLFPFSFIFVLLWLRPDPDKLIRGIFILVGIGIVVYFINFRSFPNNVFGEPLEEDLSRGILRVPIPYHLLLSLLFFYCINRYNLTSRPRWLILICFGAIMIILSVIRQVILIDFALGFLFFVRRYSLVKKIIFGSVLLITGLVIFTSLPFYKDMMELSEEQYEDTAVNDKEDVRIGAWRYYAVEGVEENPETVLFGNGVVALKISRWGKELLSFQEATGFLYADVSWAGFIYQFGYIGTFTLLYILLTAIFKRKGPDRLYLTYFLIAMGLMGIASGVWTYFYQILEIMLGFYLVYAPADSPAESHDDEALPVTDVRPKKFITR